jgi:hypothetical protein
MSAENKKTLHLSEAKAASYMLNADRRDRRNTITVTVHFDLQQALPVPLIMTSVVFNKHQLWCFNFGIHVIKDASGYMCGLKMKRAEEQIKSCPV